MFDVFYFNGKPNLFAFERPAASLEEAAELSRTEYFWYLHGNNDYTGFDFDWRPAPWERDQVHVFASQWQRNGDVFFARKWTAKDRTYHFREDQKVTRLVNMDRWYIPDLCDASEFDFSWHPDSLEPDYEYRFPTEWQREGGPVYEGTAGVKYVNSQKVKTNTTQIFYMDFMDPGSKERLEQLKTRYPDIKTTRYVSDHLTVFKRIMHLASTEYFESVWIISSICDYTDFDFSWHPPESQKHMVHCFPSGKQKRGDTFYINVENFKNQMNQLKMLDWFKVINYVKDINIKRLPWPVQHYTNDNLVENVRDYSFNTPYTVFTNQKQIELDFDPCLWSEKDRTITSFTRSNSICIVPRDTKSHLVSQIYDYPHVETAKRDKFVEKPLDIIYISNGEPDEELYYNWLIDCTKKYQDNSVKWIKGVNGRTKAYQAAAQASDTPWFFTVFAKLKVDKDFNWKWQPDYFQQPKHYIFHARNPVNGLEYGHQAMIAYNQKLVLQNTEPGIDFTLTQDHEVVPILSGEAVFNQSAWMTWRTAFREVLKLKYFENLNPMIENRMRLRTWCTRAQGQYAEFCLQGAEDAIRYYEEVEGDYEKLKLSYEWQWLQERFNANNLVQS